MDLFDEIREATVAAEAAPAWADGAGVVVAAPAWAEDAVTAADDAAAWAALTADGGTVEDSEAEWAALVGDEAALVGDDAPAVGAGAAEAESHRQQGRRVRDTAVAAMRAIRLGPPPPQPNKPLIQTMPSR